MQRILLAIAGAAAFCAAATFLLQLAVARGTATTDIVLFTSAATLLLAICAAALAYRAFNRANLFGAELERLTRSMDAAMKDLSLRGDREAAKLAELNATVSSRLEVGSSRRTAKHAMGDRETSTDASASSTTDQAGSGAPIDPEIEAIDTAIRRMVAGGVVDFSVQPIIAAGRGEAGGFEAHLHIQPEEGKPVDIRRLDRQVTDIDPAALERMAVVSATEAVRRRLGDISDRRPLHVAVSSALLQDGYEFATVLDIFKLHPSLARSVVLSLPVDIVESGQHTAAVELLSGLGIRFAVEGWSGHQAEQTKKAGIGTVKIAADRLLDRGKSRKAAPDGTKLVEAARGAGLHIIATDVQSEEDAVGLIEMGVDLMTGDRLAAPRRLKS
jgi:cyclic-di-GMP phosphodiesterase TipF (flagellum assembly factor)